MSLRLYVGTLADDGVDLAAIGPGAALDLPAGAARHAQVRRVQPGDTLVLFDGSDGVDLEWAATVVAMGRGQVRVALSAPQPVARELGRAVTLGVGMPANERMDTLVEKATELGVAAIQPLLCERAVLRLDGERAERRRQHWQGVAIAAAEQCGRVRVPLIAPVQSFAAWLAGLAQAQAALALRSEAGAARARSAAAALRLLLSPAAGAVSLAERLAAAPAQQPVLTLSGPEGGLSPAESAAAIAAGFLPASLGPRVLRADTAPLVALVAVGQAEGPV